MARQFHGTFTVQTGQKAILSSDAAGREPLYVDNFLLFELHSARGTKRFVIGAVEPVTYNGQRIPQVGPNSFEHYKLDLSSHFPKGIPIQMTVSALDYGSWAKMTDVFLTIE